MPKTQRGIGTMRTHRRLITIPRRRSKIQQRQLGKRDLVRPIPVSPELKSILYKKLQTRDVFSILFQPEYSECDINIYEFKKYVDIREQVIERLKELRFNKQVKQNIIDNLDKNSKLIEKNINYFGVAHIFD